MITHPILSELANHGVRMGLSNLRAFLEHIGISPNQCPFVVHVGGTNGKGSVCRMLEAVYLEAGYKVGLYTSPHLQHVNERIRVSGADISSADLSKLLENTQLAAAEWASLEGFDSEVPLTYFEMMTAVAIQYFVHEKTDVVILEVGLGGRLDATNVVDATVSCIVSIDYDHTDVLGEDLASIATEKAGIIKEGQDVIFGVMNDSVDRVLRYIAGTKGATIHQLGQHFHFSVGTDGLSFQSGTFRLEGVKIGLEGNHQCHNAALALEIVHSQQHLRPVTVSSTLRGLAHVQHSGRLEWLTDTVLLDAAHNPAGAEKLAEYLQEIRRTNKLPITLLLGCSKEKNLRSISVILGSVVDRIFATHCSHPRAKSSSDIVREVKVETPIFDMGDVEDAIQHCRWGEELVVVAGSIFLVGAVKDLWEQQSSLSSGTVVNEKVDDSSPQ